MMVDRIIFSLGGSAGGTITTGIEKGLHDSVVNDSVGNSSSYVVVFMPLAE